jgi:serine/threonine protein kinase
MELGRHSLYTYIRIRFHSTPQNLPSPAEVWNILSQLASGIEYMHKRDVFHRDIKPDNRTSPMPTNTNPQSFPHGLTLMSGK